DGILAEVGGASEKEVGPDTLKQGVAGSGLSGGIDGKDALVAVAGVFILGVVVVHAAGLESMPAHNLCKAAKDAVIGVEVAVRASTADSGGRAGGSTKADAGNTAQCAGKEQWHLNIRRASRSGDAGEITGDCAVGVSIAAIEQQRGTQRRGQA